MKRFILLATLAITVGSMLIATQAKAGDVVDFLPEVQQGQVLRIFFEFFARSDRAEFLTENSCLDQNSLDAIPNQLFIDDQGNTRTPEQSATVMFNSLCVALLILEDAMVTNHATAFTNIFKVMGGEELVLSNGLVIDGGKQPIRAALSVNTFLTFGLQNFLNDFSFFQILFGENSCETVTDFVLNGDTAELQWLGFFILQNDHANSQFCTSNVEGSEAELIQLAQQGSIDAALQLAVTWAQQDDDDAITSEELVQRFELRTLQYHSYGLVTIAALLSFQMSNLGF